MTGGERYLGPLMRIRGLFTDDEIDALDWKPTRRPGVTWIPLFLAANEEKEASGATSEARRGAAAVLIRMEAGTGYEPHRHVGTEDVLVLRGGYRDERGVYRTGDHVHYEAESCHGPVALGEPGDPACILYACVPEGIELLERAAEGG